jgi:hypothetical protein
MPEPEWKGKKSWRNLVPTRLKTRRVLPAQHPFECLFVGSMFVPASRSLREHMYGPYFAGLRVSAGKITLRARQTTQAVSRLYDHAHLRERPSPLTWRDVVYYAKYANPEPYRRVDKTDDAWRQLLTPAQYHVTREKGTEPPYRNAYCRSYEPGLYVCVGAAARCSMPPRSTTPYRAGPPLRSRLPRRRQVRLR